MSAEAANHDTSPPAMDGSPARTIRIESAAIYIAFLSGAIGAIYGLMLIGWSLGVIIGPIIASALIGEDKAYTVAYTTIGIIALASVALTFVTKVPRGREQVAEAADA